MRVVCHNEKQVHIRFALSWVVICDVEEWIVAYKSRKVNFAPVMNNLLGRVDDS